MRFEYPTETMSDDDLAFWIYETNYQYYVDILREAQDDSHSIGDRMQSMYLKRVLDDQNWLDDKVWAMISEHMESDSKLRGCMQ